MAIQEAPTAYVTWFPNRDSLFTSLISAADAAMVKMRSQAEILSATSETADGKALLERHFPEVVWAIDSREVNKAGGLLSLIALGFLFLTYVVDQWSYGIGFVVLALIFGGFAARVWITRRNARIILNVDSFNYTYWREPILFKDVSHLSITNHNGVQLVFHFKEARKPLAPLTLPIKRKTACFRLREVMQKQELADKTFRYFHRKMD